MPLSVNVLSSFAMHLAKQVMFVVYPLLCYLLRKHNGETKMATPRWRNWDCETRGRLPDGATLMAQPRWWNQHGATPFVKPRWRNPDCTTAMATPRWRNHNGETLFFIAISLLVFITPPYSLVSHVPFRCFSIPMLFWSHHLCNFQHLFFDISIKAGNVYCLYFSLSLMFLLPSHPPGFYHLICVFSPNKTPEDHHYLYQTFFLCRVIQRVVDAC